MMFYVIFAANMYTNYITRYRPSMYKCKYTKQ